MEREVQCDCPLKSESGAEDTLCMTIAHKFIFISSLVFGSLYFSEIPTRSKSDADK